MEIKVPVFAEDGSVEFTAVLNPEQAQALLGFALNMAVGMGMVVAMNGGVDLESLEINSPPQ